MQVSNTSVSAVFLCPSLSSEELGRGAETVKQKQVGCIRAQLENNESIIPLVQVPGLNGDGVGHLIRA